MAVVDLRIDPHAPPEALHAALSDPDRRWWAKRRLRVLAAHGALTAAFNPLLHPRGHDGKFIEKFGWVRWLDPNSLHWQTGWVRDIDANTGALTVKSGGQTLNFADAKNLYARPQRKASLELPNLIDKTTPDGWTKTGGQGGSNPGGMFQIDKPTASDSPDLSPTSPLTLTMMNVAQGNPVQSISHVSSSAGAPHLFLDPEINVVSVPRLDGEPNKYDVLVKGSVIGMAGVWYRVPANGNMMKDGNFRDELAVPDIEAFGEPNSVRRAQILTDTRTHATTLGADFTPDELAALVQSTAAPTPAVGDKFYVKTMNVPERARNEAMANHLYELLGVPVPEVAVGADGISISSKIVGNTIGFDPNNPEHVKEAQKGFIADALLANWDVVGQSYDNMQVDTDGRVWRIDAGGALAYRAKGQPKGAYFGDDVGELASLSDKKLNPTAAAVFGDISKADMLAQATILSSIQPWQLQEVADQYNLPDLGPRLIARRQNILDQLGFDPVDAGLGYYNKEPLSPTPMPMATVFNPVEVSQQMGTPPQVANSNYQLAFHGLQTEKFSDYGNADDVSEKAREEWFKNAVFVKNEGDLYAFYSDYEHKPQIESTAMFATNLLNGKVERIFVDDQSPVLSDFAKNDPSLDNLIEALTEQRDLAKAEIVAKSMGDGASVDDFMSDPDRYTPVLALQHFEMGVPAFANIEPMWEKGAYGPTSAEGAAEWPLRHGLGGALYEITAFNPDEGIKLRRRDVWEEQSTTLTPEQFNAMGPWYRPGNDTTAALWQSRYAVDDHPEANLDWEQIHHTDAALDKALSPVGWDPDADKPLPTIVPGIGDEVDFPDPDTYPAGFDKTDASTWHLVSDEQFNKAFGEPQEAIDIQNQQYGTTLDDHQKNFLSAEKELDPEFEKLIAEETAIAEALAQAQPTEKKKITNGVLDSLGPGEPILSSEMDVGDIEQLKTDLIGKHFVIMPDFSYENPGYSSSGKVLVGNGLGTVTDVFTKNEYIHGHYTNGQWVNGTGYTDVVKIRVTKGDGSTFLITSGEDKYAKVMVPVAEVPQAMTPVFKQNGTIAINGVLVGTYNKQVYPYTGVIDADHSVTGEPISFQASKFANLKGAATGLVVPIAPKPLATKTGKLKKTEDEIKALNLDLTNLNIKIAQIESDIAEAAKPIALTGDGLPLADGTIPSVGDWVFSTKDGKWGQVAQINPKFGAKNKADPANYVRVKFIIDGKPVSINRTRATLVSAPGPGQPPFVMETKSALTKNGYWFGPGSKVNVFGTDVPSWEHVLVLDTSTDGKVKVQDAIGGVHWINKDNVDQLAGSEPYIKPLPQNVSWHKPDADALNAELATLHSEQAVIAETIANSVVYKPKKKKPVGTPYPGPGGKEVRQPSYLSEQRTKAGLENLKDGYAPATGQVLRHNDGTQWVVIEAGSSNTSHKNSVRVRPAGEPYGTPRWRKITTLVVDHEAMLTDEHGAPLPVINAMEGVPAGVLPVSGVLMQRNVSKSYWSKNAAGESVKRVKETALFYVISPEGSAYNLKGEKVYPSYLASYLMESKRIGYIDTEHTGTDGQTLTVSFQQHANSNVGEMQYAVIHPPQQSAIQVLAAAPSETPHPHWTSDIVVDTGEWKPGDTWVYGKKGHPEFGPGGGEPPPGYVHPPGAIEGVWVPATVVPSVEVTEFIEETFTGPSVTQVDEPFTGQPVVPEPIPVIETPTAPESIVFTGKDPKGMELTHPPTTTSSAGVPIYKATGGPATLDVAGVAGARSVMAAVAETQSKAQSNKQTGDRQWISTYGLADHDVIEDMMVQTQVVKDDTGAEFIEVRFRLENEAAKEAHKKFMTSSANEVGDWEYAARNGKNLVPGDKLAVRLSQGSDVVPKDSFKPDGVPGEERTPNAEVIAAPVLLGKNKAGTFDVWRTQIMTAAGEIGFVDIEDRNGVDSIITATWDPGKVRTSNGAISLNPNAKADGWSVRHATLDWDFGGVNKDITDKNGIKDASPGDRTSLHTSKNHNSYPSLPGHTLQRDFEGVHVEYRTSAAKNSADGQVAIRVPVGDLDAQRKISEAMELVGVSKEKQQPPDRAALVKMATDAVFEQFSPVYIRNAKPNSPEQALAAIDAAVGTHMPKGPDGLPRKANIDDISLRVTADGRVQVLVSEDISRAIVAKNNVKAYHHSFSGSDFLAGSITGQNPGLLSTTERWAHGLFYFGQSSEADHSKDAADHLFLRAKNDTSFGGNAMIVDPVVLHRQVDYYLRDGDKYGERDSEQLRFLKNYGNSHNEIMLQRRLEPELWGQVMVSYPSQIIDKLHKQGITHAPNGMLLEDFFVSYGSADAFAKAVPSYGTEIPLGSLPLDGSSSYTPPGSPTFPLPPTAPTAPVI